MRRVVIAVALLLGLAASAGADETDRPAWATALRLRGRLAEEFAYRLHDPGDVSKLKTLGWLDGKYTFSDAVAVRAAVRGWYDAVFDATDRYPVVRLPDAQEEFSLERSEGGVRLSVLQGGWDLSLIYYDQADKSPVFFARRVSQPAGPDIVVIEPRHPRLHIVGATLGKSVEPVVVRAEAALSIGKRYETIDPLAPDGVVRRDTADWLVGVDYTFFERVDTALQLSQKVLMGSATNLTRPGVAAPVTTSVALRVTTGFFDNTLTPTLLFVVGVNRGDFRLSPRIDYLLSQAVTLSLGADLFEGPRLTLYGQFDRNDRVTLTTTWRF